MSNSPHAQARLLIRLDSAHSVPASTLASPLRRIGEFCRGRLSGVSPVSVPVGLRVETVDGHCVLALESAGPLVDLQLPAGRYHVISQRGCERRVHTLCVESGTCVKLDLNSPQVPAYRKS